MRAAVFEAFGGAIAVQHVEVPVCQNDSAIIKVEACGLCRSDWHGWMGHDSDVHLPHVPGHELAGVIQEVGPAVTQWTTGQRVTVPFCCGCGSCGQCVSGNQQVCDRYTQPGFTQWGAFAEFVEIRCADVNLVALPESMTFVTAASLGCRFATAFRGIIDQGRVTAGEIVVVHGCGGVGLSAVMIAAAVGARVIAVDIADNKLKLAKQCGAAMTINAKEGIEVVDKIRSATAGGATVSVDALGSRSTCYNSIACLRKRGRHVQIGLTLGADSDPPVPMSLVVGKELEIVGSHGMQAFEYGRMFRMIEDGRLNPVLLLQRQISLTEACDLLPKMGQFSGVGVTVIDQFTS